jgi:hypothetical protein
VLQSERGKRLEAEGEGNIKCQSPKFKWKYGIMEHWNNGTMKSCNDGINAKSSNAKVQNLNGIVE